MQDSSRLRHTQSPGQPPADGSARGPADCAPQSPGGPWERLDRSEAESRLRRAQVTILSEVGRALQRTLDIDEILLAILTAVTAGNGLGFNRAFLLLADEDGRNLTARMAVGPSNRDEAELIWKAMEQEGHSLGDILRRVSVKPGSRNRGIMKIAERLAVPVSATDNIIARTLADSASCIADAGDLRPEVLAVASILGSDHFLVVPLVAEGKRLGAILADNFITGRRIGQEDARLLETLASQGALAIVNASLHRKLRERVVELERLHDELTVNQLQLLKAEHLVAAGQLAAVLAHDLKAPLVSIGLMARAAASADSDPAEVRATLAGIGREILRVEEYLKDFARSAGGALKTSEPVDVGEIIEACLGQLRGLMVKNRVEGVVNLGHGGARVMGGAVELRQAVTNLLHNAIEAMPAGGTITVATSADTRSLRISVEDTGGGIPEEHRARVFSPFFTTKPQGSGLGLVIVKRIITDHGGRISLDCSGASGTRFSIELPVATR